MRPIAEAGDSVPTDLYANQSLIFSNLQEIYDFNSNVFVHELQESKDSPSLIGAAFKKQVDMEFSTLCTYCMHRTLLDLNIVYGLWHGISCVWSGLNLQVVLGHSRRAVMNH